MDVFHTPVMVREVIASLHCRAGAVYVDGTVGGGGHAEAILQNTAPDGLLIGIDADGDALREAEKRLAPFGERTILVKGNFADMETILAEMNIEKVDGILLDLGVSSHQLDTAERGFSFSHGRPPGHADGPAAGEPAPMISSTPSPGRSWRGSSGITARKEWQEESPGPSWKAGTILPIRTTADLAGRGGPGVSP